MWKEIKGNEVLPMPENRDRFWKAKLHVFGAREF
jgi:hypothetical protein